MAGTSPAMTKTVNEISDEQFACQLLTEHLTEQTTQKFVCEVNPDDPPDILVKWNDGALWGVEVTRTYQQVPSRDGVGATSSEGVSATLWRFAEEFAAETQSIRKRDYVLVLGPGPSDILAECPTVFDRSWERSTRKLIRRHIEDDRSETVECPGARIEPGAHGNTWRAYVFGQPAEIRLATYDMLRKALKDKSGSMPRWSGEFERKWLLLLNGYPLVDDVEEVENALKKLIRSNPNYSGFDGVFWRGYAAPALTEIPLL